MDNNQVIRLNNFINKAYECFSFAEFLKLAIVNLHEFIVYDSGMFYCEISKDCSFFKPYLGGDIAQYNKKQRFIQKEGFWEKSEFKHGNESYVYKSSDYKHGNVVIESEPRSVFLDDQDSFNIVCIRIVHKGRFLGEIYLHRSKDKPDFNDEDLFVLRIMQPHISTIFSIIHTVTAVKYIESGSIPDSSLGICVFDSDMSLVGGNIKGVEMLKVSTVYSSSILYHVKEICNDMLDDEGMNGSILLNKTLIKTSQGDVEMNICMNNESKASKQKYMITMQFADESKLMDEYKFKFTKREADIIDGLIQGKNNLQLAESLKISDNTVKTHIRNIYKKTGTNSRTELAYILMFSNH